MAVKSSMTVPPTDEAKLLSFVNIAETAAKLAEIFKLLQDPGVVDKINDCADAARAGYELTQGEKSERDEAVEYLAEAERIKKEIADAEERLSQDQAASLKIIEDAKKTADIEIADRVAAVFAREESIGQREKAADEKMTVAEQKVSQGETANADRMREVEDKERKLSEREDAVGVREKNAEEKDKALTEWEESLTKTYNKISGALNDIKS